MKLLLCLSILLLNSFIAYSGPIQDGVYYIINRAFLQAIQVADWSYADGAALNFDSITGGDNQKFRVTSVGSDFYKITAIHSGKALTVPSFMTTGDTSQITQWTDSGENLQHWTIFAVEYNGFYKIQNRYSGKALTTTQEYIYWPVEWAASPDSSTGVIEEPVAAASDVADAAVGQSAQASPAADAMTIAWPPVYSTKNKLIQNTISPGNIYQDFLFVKVAGYDAVLEPVSVAEPVSAPAVDSSFADDLGVDMAAPGPVAEAVSAPVMDTIQPIEVPAVQAELDTVDEPITSSFDVDFVENDAAVGQGEVASSVSDTVETTSGGFLAHDTPVVEEPVEPVIQEEISLAPEVAGQN